MAIALVHVRFLNVLPDRGACKVAAYLCRQAIFDRRLGMIFDYRDVADDLVHEGLILPDGAEKLFPTTAELANALDEAERRRQRKTANRTRWPQFGAHIIFALPPSPELTLDEAVEPVERLVDRAVGGLRLPALTVIHDPALTEPGARHAHILIGFREIEEAELSRDKVRGLFAQPRHAAQPNVHAQYIAEAVHWPDLARDLQNLLFAELCSEAVVDPPAPYPGRHWSAKALRESPERRDQHDELVDRLNTELINGAPAKLITKLLRGRSLIRVEEVRRLLPRFMDSATEREIRLDKIVTDPSIAAFALDPSDRRPRWLTTNRVRDRMRGIETLVDRWRGQVKRDPPLAVVLGTSRDAVVDELMLRSTSTIHRPLIVGRTYSECEEIAGALAGTRPTVGTFPALRNGHRRNPYGRRSGIGIRRGGLVIIPRAEGVHDLDLADLILRVKRFGARLVLGYDATRASLSCRLAAQLADRLGELGPHEDENAAANLRAGLIDRACQSLQKRGALRFTPIGKRARVAATFVVSDDAAQVATVDRELQAMRSARKRTKPTISVDTSAGRLELRPGEWIVYTADDDTNERIRAGRFARILEKATAGRLNVAHADGAPATIDLARFPYIRSAHSISIREARRAPEDATLLIEVSTERFAWSAALLAADRGKNAVIQIDPSVAGHLDEWIGVVRKSMPVPYLGDLWTPIDRLIEINVESKATEIKKAPSEQPEDGLENLDEMAREVSAEKWRTFSPLSGAAPSLPSASGSFEHATLAIRRPITLSPDQRQRLHDDLRAALYRNASTELGLARLQSALAPVNERRNTVAENILKACPPGGPMAALVHVLAGDAVQREPLSDMELQLELPAQLTARMPRAWSAWEIYQFQIDLRTMTLHCANWPLPLETAAIVSKPQSPKDEPASIPKTP